MLPSTDPQTAPLAGIALTVKLGGANPDGPPAVTVLNDVGLAIAAGEVVGLAGGSGSGKSTLLKVRAMAGGAMLRLRCLAFLSCSYAWCLFVYRRHAACLARRRWASSLTTKAR